MGDNSLMSTAAERTERNREIRTRRPGGANVVDLAREFSLSESRIKAVISEDSQSPIGWGHDQALELALERRGQFEALHKKIGKVADAIPISQASAKIGALKAESQALDKLFNVEQALGLLPDQLGGVLAIADARRTAQDILFVLKSNAVAGDIRDQMLEALTAPPT